MVVLAHNLKIDKTVNKWKWNYLISSDSKLMHSRFKEIFVGIKLYKFSDFAIESFLWKMLSKIKR